MFFAFKHWPKMRPPRPAPTITVLRDEDMRPRNSLCGEEKKRRGRSNNYSPRTCRNHIYFIHVRAVTFTLALIRSSPPLNSKVRDLMYSCMQNTNNNNNASYNMTETAEAKPRKLIPVSQPISVLPTDIARLYTHLHPVVILTVYYFCFPYLVDDPVSVLSKAIAPLAHLQITYCVVCLPQSSGSSTSSSTSSKGPTTRKRVQFAQSTKSKPASVRSRITVCYSPLFLFFAAFVSTVQ